MERFENEDSMLEEADSFEIVRKIGKGSYGDVFKALNKTTNDLVAIKQIPVESDLHDIVKEIAILKQCDSEFIVRYYGSYVKETSLYIVMEYCSVGSVSDLMKNLSITLTEQEIKPILYDTLRGLEYLHLKKKIHRDIKSGNILLNDCGRAKLADFGVAGQLSDTNQKRNTFIGSPYFMAPEVLIQTGYDCSADIWSLGITLIEMFDGRPPLSNIHPMRAIFMIPHRAPPTFQNPERCSDNFKELVAKCLVKNPADRLSSSELLRSDFLADIQETDVLKDLLTRALENMDKFTDRLSRSLESEDSTLIAKMNPKSDNANGETLNLDDSSYDSGSVIRYSDSTFASSNQGTMIVNKTIDSMPDYDNDTFQINSSTISTYNSDYGIKPTIHDFGNLDSSTIKSKINLLNDDEDDDVDEDDPDMTATLNNNMLRLEKYKTLVQGDLDDLKTGYATTKSLNLF